MLPKRMQDPQTFYDVIGVSNGSSQQEIKEKYREKLLKYSPDKVSHDATEEDIDKARVNYFKLQDAWRVLSDPDLRKRYDAELTANTLEYDTPADSEVDISELEYNPDDDCYYHPCRCGGEYEIPGSNLDQLSYCNTCSLSIHIIDTTKKK